MTEFDPEDLTTARSVLSEVKEMIQSKSGDSHDVETLHNAMWLIEDQMTEKSLKSVLETVPNDTKCTIRKNEDGDYFLLIPAGNDQDADTITYEISVIKGRLLEMGGEYAEQNP
jgi:hypothetical protein